MALFEYILYGPAHKILVLIDMDLDETKPVFRVYDKVKTGFLLPRPIWYAQKPPFNTYDNIFNLARYKF